MSFERLSRLAAEMFGLTISPGAIANLLRRLGAGMAALATPQIEEVTPLQITPKAA